MEAARAMYPMHVDGGPQALAERPPWREAAQALPAAEVVDAGSTERVASLELEALVLNLESAVRVRARHQFFSWTQGALQNLIAHDLLVCALCQDGPALQCVDSFSIAPVEPAHFNELFRQDASLVPAFFKALEQNECRPVILDAGNGSPHAGGALARELARLGASSILVHGTHDAAGRVSSLHVFACRPGVVGPRQAYLAELVVPPLHAAWMRTRVNWQAQGHGMKRAEAGLVTVREREVLEWIYRGKSNIEVGMILGISPLTVKNHVQKILRKLDVLNRTQAVGKALTLRILDT
jgi:transcriptional regulator EpsA